MLGIVASSSALAECRGGTSEILKVSDFNARVVDSYYSEVVELSITIENISDYDVRMLDGRIFFNDVLGRNISNLSLHEDARIPNNDTYTQVGAYSALGSKNITRLATADASDIIAIICVEGLVTTEGGIYRFD